MMPTRGARTLVYVLAISLTAVLACSRPAPPAKEYQLTGQILSIKPETREVLVKHGDIQGFMPAMTMPYEVEDPSLLEGKEPGDLISATLVVANTRAYLSAIDRTGHAAIEAPAAGPEISAAEMVKPGEEVPDAALVDENGQARPLSSYRGQRLALTFIYTRCPDAEFCPLMSRQFAELQRRIAADPGLRGVQLLSISFDPEYDTPAVLRDYAAAQHADPAVWHFATAPIEDMTRFAARFGLTVTREGSPVLVHNLATAVIDAQGRLVSLHSTNQWTPTDLVDELKTAAASAN